MNDREIILKILEETGWSKTMLAEAIGTSKQALHTQLTNSSKTHTGAKGMSAFSLLSMAEALGYEVVVRSKKPNDKTTYKLDKNSFGKKGE